MWLQVFVQGIEFSIRKSLTLLDVPKTSFFKGFAFKTTRHTLVLYPCSPWCNWISAQGDCRSSAQPSFKNHQHLKYLILLSQWLKSLVHSHSDLFCLHIVGVEGYCFTWSHSTHKHSQETNINARGGIQTQNPSNWVAPDPHFSLCSYCCWRSPPWEGKYLGDLRFP
jgi:hypothetical protein